MQSRFVVASLLSALVIGTALARVVTLPELLSALKPNVVKTQEVKLGAPLPMHSRERKFILSVKTDTDEIVNVEWFLASPKGSRTVFKTSSVLPSFTADTDASAYALTYIISFASSICLGVDLGKKADITDWIGQRLLETTSSSERTFQKVFGVLKVTVGGSVTGFRAIILERTDQPGKAWVNTCPL
ncbi:MAG: hypothetical protein HC933_15455 [Pleurocapsa sp. SU_196_0]|nr:hypothetical protein [Pleurocapsa sp. SU_196_0]